MSPEIWAALVGALVGGAIGFLSGIYGATYGQDRERGRREQSAALAIREDVRRITGELTIPGRDRVRLDASGKPSSPQIHPWIVSLIPELASALPEAFARLMQLQSKLKDRAILHARYYDALESLLWSQRELARNQTLAHEVALDPKVMRDRSSGFVTTLDTYEGEVRRLEPVVADNEYSATGARAVFSESEVALRTDLELLDRMLAGVIDRPLLGRLPSLPTPDAQNWDPPRRDGMPDT